MQLCPKCQSTEVRKNGRPHGNQRYKCKNCGYQFVEMKSSLQSSLGIEGVVDNNHLASSESKNGKDHSTVRLVAQEILQAIALPEFFESPVLQKISSRIQNLAQSQTPPDQGIAILLLDAENLNKFDLKVEKFLTKLCTHPLQVKIAFANWKNTGGDTELYDRGYQLFHVPIGKNSADAQMIAVGASIYRHYPNAKEVFVCSSDWLLTHLCNELQSQGLTVYRVRKQNNSLTIENRQTGAIDYYSLALNTEIPAFDKIVQKIETLIDEEYKSLEHRLDKLSTVADLFKERRNLTNNSSTNLVEEPLPKSANSPINEETNKPESKKGKIEATTPPEVITSNIKTIGSRTELERIIIEIINSIKASDPQEQLSINKISTELHKLSGEAPNAIVKRLKLGANFTKFLKSCSTLKLNEQGQTYELDIPIPASLTINS